ncbi:MAG: prolipoprotein diacylglyceryl transferase family protein [Candidatus Solibacter sp.]
MNPFQFWGGLGLMLGSALAVVVTQQRALSIPVTVLMLGVSICVFYTVAMATRIIQDRERLVYYHHEIAILFTLALLLRALGLPVLAYLDIAVLGLGSFLAFGRIGCWRVGCCHGRPHRWGRPHPGGAGMPPYGADVLLFPVQPIESAWVFTAVIVGVALALTSKQAGEVFTFYTFFYGAGRFLFEFFRGDPERPFWKGVSEAQWTSWLLVTAAAIGELAHYLPFHTWHFVEAAGMSAAVILLVANDGEVKALFRPAHLCQLSEALECARALTSHTGALHVATTSLGLRVSATRIQDGVRRREMIAYSRPGLEFPAQDARRLGQIIVRLRGSPPAQFQQGDGVYHVILT